MSKILKSQKIHECQRLIKSRKNYDFHRIHISRKIFESLGIDRSLKIIELELLIILLLGVTTYVGMPAYRRFRDFLACTTQPNSLFCYGDSILPRFEPTAGILLNRKYF